MIKSIVKDTPLKKSKTKLTKHTARKTVVKKPRAASVERQSIIQVTAHARKSSDMSQILSVCLHSQQLPVVFLVFQQRRLSPATSSACEHLKTSGRARVIQEQCSSPEPVNPNIILSLRNDYRTWCSYRFFATKI